MCVVCNIIDKDYIDTALAVKDTITDEVMTIPLRAPVEAYHPLKVFSPYFLTLT